MKQLIKYFPRVFPFLSQEKAALAEQNILRHIAIIMDGNGRWAQKRGLPRAAGHRAGAEALRHCVRACLEIGIKYLTVYAFSTENWLRPREEVSFLMNLLSQSIDSEAENLHKNNVRLRFLGRIKELSSELQSKIAAAEAKTQNNDGLNLTVMLNYGGRAEIVDAVNALIERHPGEKIAETEITAALYTGDLPDPDLLVRTASELRVSNFLLWQIAYAEIYVTKTFWPDFRKEHLLVAIKEYGQRVRKFGKIKEQI
ncbi:MAG: isoprenyl transferase [Candidatus Margulisiibacteriota bacterium]